MHISKQAVLVVFNNTWWSNVPLFVQLMCCHTITLLQYYYIANGNGVSLWRTLRSDEATTERQVLQVAPKKISVYNGRLCSATK